MERLRLPADRARFVTAWTLARHVLSRTVGRAPVDLVFTRECVLCGHPSHGKPRLLDSTVDFSLSHAGDRVLLAVSETLLVGVDIEERARPIGDLAGQILHPDESGSTEDLLRVWVRKEALLKASGHGLVKPMTQLSLANPPVGSSTNDLPVGGRYLAAVATLARVRSPSVG